MCESYNDTSIYHWSAIPIGAALAPPEEFGLLVVQDVSGAAPLKCVRAETLSAATGTGITLIREDLEIIEHALRKPQMVGDRDKNSFKGNLRIADAPRFWAPSKYLVVVQQ